MPAYLIVDGGDVNKCIQKYVLTIPKKNLLAKTPALADINAIKLKA